MKRVLALVICLALVLTLAISASALKLVPVSGIQVDNNNVVCYIGKAYTPKISLLPANTTQNILKYSTSNKNVAAISSKGVITPVKAGNATITVTSSANSKVTSKINITVLAVPKNQVTLTWYMVGDKQPADTALVMSKVNAYLKDKLNVKLDLKILGWGDPYDQKVNTMLSSGEPFDICFTAGWAANYYMNAPAGYFTELNSLLAKYPLIGNVTGKDFLNGGAIDGKNYAVPTNKEQVHNWGYVFQKTLLNKYKFNTADIDKAVGVDKKMAVVESWFAKIKSSEPSITPLLVIGADSPFQFLDWDRLSDDGVPGALYADNHSDKVINHFVAPESVAFYKKLRDYYNKGYIAKDAATMQNTAEQMKTGKYFAVEQSLKPGKDAEVTVSTGVQWVQADITSPVMSNRETTGAMLAIPSASKNPERAFQFIQLLYTDVYLRNLLNFGVEGIHYTFGKDDRITPTPDFSKWGLGSGWRYGDNFKDYLQYNEDPQKWQKFLQFNAKGLVEKSLGFIFDKSPVDTQASACKTVVGNYSNQLWCGSVDTDSTVSKMTKELKDAGVDALIAEMQKQYDAWRAAKK